MAVRVEAFLSLERSLIDRMVSSWLEMAKDLLPDIVAALREQDYATAEQIINNLDFEPIYEENKDYIKFLTISFMLFGATRLTPEVQRTAMASLNTNEIVDAAVENFGASIMGYVEDSVRENLMTLVSEMALSDEEAPLAESEIEIETEAKAEVAKQTRVVNPFVSFANAAETEAAKTLQLAASLHAVRLSAYGFTAEAEVLEEVEYTISAQLDSRVCPICEYMDGKTFRVADAKEALNVILREKNPDALKSLQAWPRQDEDSVAFFKSLSDDELIDRNWHIPPFHPNCRCLLVHVEAVPRIEDTASYIAATGGGSGVEDVAVREVAEAAAQREATLLQAEQNSVNYVLGQTDSVSREYGAAYNPKTGEVVGQFRGNEYSIPLEEFDTRLLRDTRFVHNHPGDVSLSTGDFRVNAAFGMNSIVAMARDGTKYVGRTANLADRVQAQEAFRVLMARSNDQLHQIARANLLGPIQAGAITVEEANIFIQHMANDVLHELKVVAYSMESKGAVVGAAMDKVSNVINPVALRAQLLTAFRSVVDRVAAELLAEIMEV